MSGTDISSTFLSLGQVAANEDGQMSWSSVSSLIKSTSLLAPKDENKKSLDSSLESLPSETTALLASSIPRIGGFVDHEAPESNPFLSVYWQEAKMLIRYALPVFGFVSPVS